ncbi:DUF2955 domain-containing protein [Aromatoleum sp.]|uniref:DUF2955 domain-containing protein n=1 Tax=Aromatoleum sp. TaxID=2307007 RepID=UPI002FCC0EFE
MRAPDPRPQRALRLAGGTALALAAGFALAPPLPYVAPLLALFLLAQRNQALPLKAAIGLPLLVMLTTGCGLLLIPPLQHAPVSGLLLIALCLFHCFRYNRRGGNALLGTFMIVGLTLIAAAGASSFALAVTVIEALAKGLLLAVLAASIAHAIFPEPAAVVVPPPPAAESAFDAGWVALRATLVVMPALLVALIDPSRYLPLIMKSVSLGQQVCSRDTRDAGRELVGATLLGGALAMLFWSLLGIQPKLWMFFLWTLLFVLLLARRLYRLLPGRASPGFWLNCMATLVLLLGQSVEDSAAGKDVYRAFAIRLALFIGVALYAWLAVSLIDRWRAHSIARRARKA